MPISDRKLCFCLVLTVLLAVAAKPALAQYAGGSGTSADPFQIASQTHFENIANNPSSVFELIDNIALTAFTGIDFNGELRGNGLTIHIDITDENIDFAGLFRRLQTGAVVRDLRFTGNLNLDNVLFTGLIAPDMEDGLIENVHTGVEIVVAGTRHDGTLGSGHGGLVARKTGGIIRDSSNSGGVEGYLDVAGLAVRNWGGVIERSFNTGNVRVTGENTAGGLVGNNRADIIDTYSTGAVSGGICANCGGLVGVMSSGSIQNSYASGQVTSSSTLKGGLVGQFVGDSVTNSFFDVQTSGQTEGPGTGLSTAEMKSLVTFTDAGWDFAGVWQIASEVNAEAISYPYLRAFTYDAFDVVEENNPVPGLVGPARRFLITGSSTQVAGSSQTLTLLAHDVRDQLVALYVGDRTLVFDGASAAPDGTLPQITDKNGGTFQFGQPVTLAFVDGVAEASGGANGAMTLVEAGPAMITATADNMVTEPGDGLAVTVTAGAPAQMSIEAGDGQAALPGETLPVKASVRIEDEFGNPATDVSVSFDVTAGGGSVDTGEVFSDQDGIAAVTWTLGPEASLNELTAASAGLDDVVFTATALPDSIFSDRFVVLP